MKEDYIIIEFSSDTYTEFHIGDYVDFKESQYENEYPLLFAWGKKFCLKDKVYKPTLNENTGGYDYSLRLDADYFMWGNKIFKFTPQYSGMESTFQLAGRPYLFMDLFIANLNALGYYYGYDENTGEPIPYSYVIEGEYSNKNIALEFTGEKMLDALGKIIEALDPDGKSCEYVIVEGVIRIGRCGNLYGNDGIHVFRIGETLESVSINNNSSEYANRLYAFGSTNNISERYRKEVILTVNDIYNGTTFRDTERKIKYTHFPASKQTQGDERTITTTYLPTTFTYGGGTGSYETTKWLEYISGYVEKDGRKYIPCQTGAVNTDTHSYVVSQFTITGGLVSIEIGDVMVSSHDERGIISMGSRTLSKVKISLRLCLTDGTVLKELATREMPTYREGYLNFGSVDLSDIPEYITDTTLQIVAVISLENYSPIWEITDWDIYNMGTIYHYEYSCVNMIVNTEFNPSLITRKSYPYVRTPLAILSAENTVLGYMHAELNFYERYSEDDFSTYIKPVSYTMFDGAEPPALANGLRLGVCYYIDENGNLAKEGLKINDIVKAKVPINFFTSIIKEPVNGIAEMRLMLPQVPVYKTSDGVITYDAETDGVANTMVYDGSGKIESVRGLREEQYVESVIVFEEVYPTFEETIKNLQEVDATDKEGNKFIAYQFRSTKLKDFDANTMSDNGMQMSFNAGNEQTEEGDKLAGYTFKMLLKKCEHDYTLFEIDRNDDYYIPLPDKNTGMVPKNGDPYNIIGLDVSMYDDGGSLTAEAELELVRVALLYMGYKDVDTKTYNCSLMASYAHERLSAHKFFHLGDEVTIISGEVNITSSRIIGGEFKLDVPYDNPTIIVGESSSYSRIGAISQSIKGLAFSASSKTIVTGGGGGVDVIKRDDTTIETDLNIYSAARSKKEDDKRLRKDIDDETPHKLTMGELEVESESVLKGDLSVEGDTQLQHTNVGKNLEVAGEGNFEGDLTVKGGASVNGVTVIGTANSQTNGDLIMSVRGLALMRSVFFGDYEPGLIAGANKGALIHESGDARFKSVSISEFLEVPEIRFNRATVSIGIGLRSAGGGIIERVEPDVDNEGNILNSGWVRLKLEEGEYGAIQMCDFNLGFWHNETVNPDTGERTAEDNALADYDGKDGDFELAGFQSVYFRIDGLGVLSPNDEEHYDQATGINYLRHTFADEDGVIGNTKNDRFHYVIRGTEGSGRSYPRHPHDGMHFGLIANNDTKTEGGRTVPRYPDRQSLVVTTTLYELMLQNLNSWNWTSANIVKIDGKLDGFSMQSVYEGQTYIKHFTGNGTVLGNAYIYGKIDQFERLQPKIEIDTDGDTFLSYGETKRLTCRLNDQYGQNITDSVVSWNIIRESGDPVEDAAWGIAQKATDFKDATKNNITDDGVIVGHYFDLEDGPNASDLGTGLSTLFTIQAYQSGSSEPITVQIAI